jgi:hypothetical protein
MPIGMVKKGLHRRVVEFLSLHQNNGMTSRRSKLSVIRVKSVTDDAPTNVMWIDGSDMMHHHACSLAAHAIGFKPIMCNEY